MKKITLLVILIIMFNFIYSSFFEIKVYATVETTSNGGSESSFTIDDYKLLDEGKAKVDGKERNIDIGDSDSASVASKFGTTLATFSAIFVKLMSNVANDGGFYRTDSTNSASKVGLFTINSLIFDEYLLFNSKAYQTSQDLNSQMTPTDSMKLIDDFKNMGASFSDVLTKIGFAFVLPVFIYSIVKRMFAKNAMNLAAWTKILIRWGLCLALLIFCKYILVAIQTVSGIFTDTFWDMRIGFENAGYKCFETTIENNVMESISKTGGVVTLAYSVEFFVVVLLQVLFFLMYVVRSFGLILLFCIAPAIIVIHGFLLMLGREKNILGKFFKLFLGLSFIQPLQQILYLIFFFSLSEIAINVPILGFLFLYGLYHVKDYAEAMFGIELGSSIFSKK